MGCALPDPLPPAASPGRIPRVPAGGPGIAGDRARGQPDSLRSDVPNPDRRAGCPGLRCAGRCAVTNVDNVFRYGGSGESNGHSIASQEQQPAEGGEVPPPKHPPIRTEPAPDPRGGGGVTGRLILVALILILLGTGAGLAGALALPKTYGARAEILYPIGQDQQGGDPLRQDRQLSTQLVFLKSRAVLGPIAQKQGMQYKELDENLSVEVLQTSEVIQVEQLTAGVLAGTATQIALNEARTQLTASVDREKAIQVRIDEINLTGRSGPNAQLLTPPYVLPDPVSPQPLIAAGTGALVGLLVAGGVVAVGARRRTRP